MAYAINDLCFTTEMIIQRIKNADLIPSMEPLLKEIDVFYKQLQDREIVNLHQLSSLLKNKKIFGKLSIELFVSEEFLVLLKRETDSWMAKNRKIEEFDWINNTIINQLKEIGFYNSEIIYNELYTKERINEVNKLTGITIDCLTEIADISNLVRIRWVSPSFARVIRSAGYNDISQIMNADKTTLTKLIEKTNADNKYYNGKIGERDINRLIFEAKYAS